MSTGSIVALVVILVVAGLAWLFLKGRKGTQDATVTRPSVAFDSDAVEPAPAVDAAAAAAAPDAVPPRPASPQAMPPSPPMVATPPPV
ncbi:MAG: hypothetical protein M3R22_07120, partial [Pseudomonadota bacterium]|nr:hypothetical protein [Pseudomonadota bacterium]